MLNSELFQERYGLQHRFANLSKLLAAERVISNVLIVRGKSVKVLPEELEHHEDAPKLYEVVFEQTEMSIVICPIVTIYVHEGANLIDQLAKRRGVLHPLQRNVLTVDQIVRAQHLAENTIAVKLFVQYNVACRKQVDVLKIAVFYESAELSVHVVVDRDVKAAVEEFLDL